MIGVDVLHIWALSVGPLLIWLKGWIAAAAIISLIARIVNAGERQMRERPLDSLIRDVAAVLIVSGEMRDIMSALDRRLGEAAVIYPRKSG